METFARKIQQTAARLEGWQRRVGSDDDAADLLADQIVAEIQTALEQLRVAEEEMRTQNEELADAREAVEAERLRYQELFDYAPDAYLVTDTDGTTREANHAAVGLLGVRRSFLVGKPLAAYVAREDRRAFRALLLRLAKGGGDAGGERGWEASLKPRGRAAHPAEFTAVVVRGAEGEDTGVRWLVRDVTERKALEAERARHAAEEARRAAEEQAAQRAAERERRFVREVLASTTGGRLCLCASADDLPAPFAPASTPVPLDVRTLRVLRRESVAAAERAGLPQKRVQDLEVAVGEAAMNAVKHGGGGVGEVRADADAGVVQVWVRDQGRGIREDSIHRATLEPGFTTAGTLGHGFFLLLNTCDRAYLLTGPGGTTVVLEQERTPPEPAWLRDIRTG